MRNIYDNSEFFAAYAEMGRSKDGLKNEPKYLFITGKRVCVFLIRNADSFVIAISPKVELYVV